MRYNNMPPEAQIAAINALQEVISKQDVPFNEHATVQQRRQFKEFANNALAAFNELTK